MCTQVSPPNAFVGTATFPQEEKPTPVRHLIGYDLETSSSNRSLQMGKVVHEAAVRRGQGQEKISKKTGELS